MSRAEHDAPRSRIEILEEEGAIHGGLEKHFLGRAATAASEGDMDAFRWAMDTSREAGEHAAALHKAVRTEHNERLLSLSTRRMLDGHVLPSFPPTPDPIDESALEHLARSMAAHDGPIVLLKHSYGVPPMFNKNIPPLFDIMDGMVAHRPEDFPGTG